MMRYSPTGKLRRPGRKSSSRARPILGCRARSKKRSVIESIRRSAISMLPLLVTTNTKYRRGRSRLADGYPPLAGRILLGGEACTTTLLYAFGELTHRLLRNGTTFAACERGFCLIDCGKDFSAGTLALFPQGKCFPQGVFLVLKASALNGMADECLLIRGQIYFHRCKRRREDRACQGRLLPSLWLTSEAAGSAERSTGLARSFPVFCKVRQGK